MYRGTTPALNFKFKNNLSELNITALFLTFSQNDTVILEKTLEEIEIVDNTIKVNLSQEETLKIEDKKVLHIQARIKVDEKAYATNIIKTSLNAILKEGVI